MSKNMRVFDSTAISYYLGRWGPLTAHITDIRQKIEAAIRLQIYHYSNPNVRREFTSVYIVKDYPQDVQNTSLTVEKCEATFFGEKWEFPLFDERVVPLFRYVDYVAEISSESGLSIIDYCVQRMFNLHEVASE